MNTRLLVLLSALVIAWPPAAAASDEEPDSGQSQLLLEDLRTFTDVFNQVRKNFVEEIDDITLLKAAIRGMVGELDEYSVFVDADAYQAMNDQSLGRYGGIGLDLDTEDRRIVVTGVYQSGPAVRAGVIDGDLITAVNGKPVKGRRLQDTIAELRGEPGTEVDVEFKSGRQPARTLRLEREYIPARSVESRLLDDRIGYFRISHFHEDSDTELGASIRRLESRLEAPLQGAILDLRGNPGGVLQAAAAMADGFLEEGRIVNTQSRYPDTQLEFSARPGEWLPEVPLVVLVNAETASASEVLAGALQDHGRAVIAGQRTFGKGSVQSVLALRNGSALRLTTARYFTPSGQSIQGVGIEPDVPLEPGSEEEVLAQVLELLADAAPSVP